MGWGFWLTVAVVVSVLVALVGLRPRGARPVASSQLMTIARVVLVIALAVLFYLFLRAQSAG